MFLSKLELDPRCRAVRLDLADPYETHRSLRRGFSDGAQARLLWRLEQPAGSPPFVLAQSRIRPNWEALSGRDPNYLFGFQVKEFAPRIGEGQRLLFRLRANPTVKRNGKRHGLLRVEDQIAWFRRLGGSHGFEPEDVTVEKNVRLKAKRNGATVTLVAATFAGHLSVTEPEKLGLALEWGIGHGRAFGLGLLSLAR